MTGAETDRERVERKVAANKERIAIFFEQRPVLAGAGWLAMNALIALPGVAMLAAGRPLFWVGVVWVVLVGIATVRGVLNQWS